MKHTLLYIYDALCGWCYGFSPTMQAFAKNHVETINVEVISGGMITGDRVGPIGEVAGYISWAYKEVERATGVKFGKGFLEGTMKEGTAIFTSLPPAIAMSIFKEEKPEEQLAFAARLQKAIYYDGIAPRDLEAYGELAAEFGLAEKDFAEKMTEQAYMEKAFEAFDWTKRMGITGFPTLLLQVNKEWHLLGKGAMSLDALEKHYQKITKEK